MTAKKYVVGFAVVLSLFLVWYLGFKKSDYTINFKSKTATMTIFQGIQDWAKEQKAHGDNYEISQKKGPNYLAFTLKKGDEVFDYEWEITALNDSISSVAVNVRQEGARLYNRLTVPFFATQFKQDQIQKITNFRDGLNEHLKKFKVHIDGQATSDEVHVAYVNLKSVFQEKAQMMIMNDGALTGYLQRNNIKIVGKPYLEVLNMDLENEKLDFNYCFPIAKDAKYIPDTAVKYKTIKAQKGLKATYYGNMRTSDRAWFALLDYAHRNNIKLANTPIEHFYANPFNGGDELKWKTEIVIPFSK